MRWRQKRSRGRRSPHNCLAVRRQEGRAVYPEAAHDRQCAALFPYASMQRNQSFILGLRCQYTPAPGRVSVLPTSGVLASWGYFPDDASRTSGTQGRPLHLWLVALATCKRPALPRPPEQKASGNVGGALPATLGTSLKVI